MLFDAPLRNVGAVEPVASSREGVSLEQLAASYGVEASYYDVAGRLVVAGHDALVAMLEALGCRAEREAVGDGLRARRSELAERLLQPIAVSWDGTIIVRLRSAESTNQLDIQVHAEDGQAIAGVVRPDQFDVRGRFGVDGREYADVAVPLPAGLPIGYHRIEITNGMRRAESALWLAPGRAAATKGQPGWGVFAPTYSLRSERNGGVGDFADLETLARFVGERGGQAVATLPLLPTFLDGPYDPSPYAPISRLFWNEIYLAVDRLPDLASVPLARALWANQEYQTTAEALRKSSVVDYGGVLTHKRRLLSLLSEAAFADPEERTKLERHLADNPRVGDYARFRAVIERQRRPFRQWPERMRERFDDADFEIASFHHHVFCQVRAHEQMTALTENARASGVGLYMDLPLGAHSSGYDAFRYGHELMEHCSTGAPPDGLFEGGQNWGFSPPHPGRASASGHTYFIAALRHQMRHASMVRIDHVMSLHRLFCIPKGFGSREGVYVRQPEDELYAAVCIESARAETSVVGEDLGTVPDEVRARMARHGIGRLFVLQYEDVPGTGRTYSIPAGAVASLNTHDMPTFPGFLLGRDLDARRDLGLLDDEGLARERRARATCRQQMERWLESRRLLQSPSSDEQLLLAELMGLAQSPACLVLSSIDDLLGETEPQNLPGTGTEQPNWRRKLRRTMKEIMGSPDTHRLLSALRREEPRLPDVESRPRSLPCARFTDMDLHLFNEGTHRHILLGAHPGELDGRLGTFFSAWAPNAASIHVVGDFNGWTSRDAPLFVRGASGVWEGFVPGVGEGDLYKFHVTPRGGVGFDKADPFALRAELAPRTASIVWNPAHDWQDGEWMAARSRRNAIDGPCSIYEVHLGSFQRAADGALLGYRALAPYLVEHVKRLGFTHVELLPVMEHPFYGSWGYQVTGYFAATGRYGPPEDLMALVDALHDAGIGVIFDWVPGHFPTDAHGLGNFDGTHLFEHADPRRGFHPDWKSHIFNYGRHEVRSFLTSSALYWLERFHGDGLRVDGVASMLYLDYSRADGEWIPNEFGGRENLEAIGFLRWLNESVYAHCPDVQMTAEESTAWPMVSRPTYLGGLGFGTKWDLGWMHDTLEYFSKKIRFTGSITITG